MLNSAAALARIAILSGIVCQTYAQVQTVIQIDIENYAYYYGDNPDYSKYAGTAQATSPIATKTFASFIGWADIVRVNGKPAKGTWSIRATHTNLTPTPAPGQSIADATRNFFADWIWEIQQADGTPIGTITATGLGFGPAPPGSPSGLSPTAASAMSITGGTGAFLGIRGQAGFSQITTAGRAASATEDPSVRRTFGGGSRSFLLTLIPITSPAVLSNEFGPLVLHAKDFSQVSSENPVSPNEVLTIIASGLGPTVPSVDLGQMFPSSPLALVNSPLQVTVDGVPADVLFAGGYPGSTAYQINFLLPSSLSDGSVLLLFTSAWLPSVPIQVPVAAQGS
jgi:uncharacterized protein (TIGR03437 family)